MVEKQKKKSTFFHCFYRNDRKKVKKSTFFHCFSTFCNLFLLFFTVFSCKKVVSKNKCLYLFLIPILLLSGGCQRRRSEKTGMWPTSPKRASRRRPLLLQWPRKNRNENNTQLPSFSWAAAAERFLVPFSASFVYYRNETCLLPTFNDSS
jgi:hypothetical protein